MKTKDIRVFIIAVDGIPRNRKLIESLIKVFPKHNIYILDAVQPKDIDSIKMKKLTMQNKLMLGRKTTPNEIAVTQSHNLCYKIAYQFEWQNIMIFEDDVKFYRGYHPVEFDGVLILSLGKSSYMTEPQKSYLENPTGPVVARKWQNFSMPGASGYAIKPDAALGTGPKGLVVCGE